MALFYIDITSYTHNDDIPYKTCGNVDDLIKVLELFAEHLFKWFSNNQMKDNTGKFHLLLNFGEPERIKFGLKFRNW